LSEKSKKKDQSEFSLEMSLFGGRLAEENRNFVEVLYFDFTRAELYPKPIMVVRGTAGILLSCPRSRDDSTFEITVPSIKNLTKKSVISGDASFLT
jgi:hypothetical protein